MKKIRLISWILCAALLVQGFALRTYAQQDGTQPASGMDDTTAPTQTEDVTAPTTPESLPDYTGQDASIAGGSRTIEAMSSLQGSQRILNTARSAMLYEINSDTVVYSWNPDEVVVPYDLVKIMTCLVAMEQCDWEEIVTVNQSTLDTIDYVSNIGSDYTYHSMYLVAGEEVRVKDLLYGIIVWNANDAAAVLAEYVAGSQGAFVKMMNEKAAELGCTNTYFANVHGLDTDEQHTTARDIARILKEVSKNEDLLKIMCEDFWDVNETNMSEYRAFMYSDNYMCGMLISDLYYDHRVSGGKVSETPDGLRSFACVAESGDLLYAIVVLETTPKRQDGEIAVGGNNEFVETQQLIDIGFEGYSVKQILRKGQITTRFTVNNGSNDVVAGPDREIVTLLPSGIQLSDLTLRYEKTNGVLDAPVEKGKQIDTITVWYGNVCVAQAGLVTMNGAEVSLSNNAGADTGGDGIGVGLTIFLVIVGLIVGAAAVLYIIRFVRIGMVRKRRRHRRKNRRRSL